MLAHWGADVIKVESPKGPDPMRLFGGSLEPGCSSPTFKHYSRGKTLDRDRPHHPRRDRTCFTGWPRDADVFLTSYLTPTRRKLKIDVD